MTSQPGKQIISMQILPVAQKIKSNFSLQKSFKRWGRETSSKPLFDF